MKQNGNFVFNILAIIILLILGARELLSISVNQYALLGFMVSVMPFMSYEKLVSYTAFLIPISIGVNILVLWGALVFLFIKAPKISRKQYVFTLYFALSEIIALLIWGKLIQYNMYIFYISYIGIFFFLIFDRNKLDLSKPIRLFCYATVFAISIITLKAVMIIGLDGIAFMRVGDTSNFDNFDEDTTIQSFVMNPNTLAYFSVVCYSCLLIGYKKLRINIWLYYCLMALTIINGVLAVSRTWLVLVAVITLFYFTQRKSTKKLIIATVAVVVLSVFGFSFINSIIDRFDSRMSNNSLSTAGGRAEIFQEYNDMVLNNPQLWMFGTSVTNYKNVSNDMYSFSATTKQANGAMHNATQQIYVCCGFLGLIVFGVVAYKIYQLYMRRGRIPKIYFLPILSAFLFCQTIQFLTPSFLMLPFIIGVFCLRLGENSQSRFELQR